MKRNGNSIQKKMMRVILLTSGIILLLTCAAFFAYEFITYRDITKRELSTLARVISANSTGALAFDNKGDADEVLSSLRAQPHITAACLYNAKGEFYTGYPDSLTAAQFPQAPGAEGYEFTSNALEGFEPVIQEGERQGTLFIKSDLNDIYSRFRLYALIAVSFILLSFGFAYLFSRGLQRVIAKPIMHLAQTAGIISEKQDYSVRAEKMSDDELGALTDAFNQMLAQIQSQSNEIRQLNTNLEGQVAERTRELEDAIDTLRRQNEFIETIIDSSVDLIAVFNERLEFEVLNKKADEIYRRDRHAMLGESLLQVFPELAGGAMVNNLQRALNGEFIHDDAYRSITGRYLENFFIPLQEGGRIRRVLVVGHDITTIVQANEQLRNLNNELEKSNRDLEQFAYVASHDLQEPLRKIQLFSELSSKNTKNPDILLRYLDKINTSAARMSELIQAVLNYSRISRKSDAHVAVDLNEIVNNIRNDLELAISEKKAEISIDPLPVYEGNALQLHQLFLNLVSNALKFTEQTPRIAIQSRLVQADGLLNTDGLRAGTTYLELRFEDNGIGFDQQYADQIFAIFQRLHARSDYPGTGIGLTLCKKIVENHGGAITVKSELGQGTTFFVYLPASGIVPGLPADQQQQRSAVGATDAI